MCTYIAPKITGYSQYYYIIIWAEESLTQFTKNDVTCIQIYIHLYIYTCMCTDVCIHACMCI